MPGTAAAGKSLEMDIVATLLIQILVASAFQPPLLYLANRFIKDTQRSVAFQCHPHMHTSMQTRCARLSSNSKNEMAATLLSHDCSAMNHLLTSVSLVLAQRRVDEIFVTAAGLAFMPHLLSLDLISLCHARGRIFSFVWIVSELVLSCGATLHMLLQISCISPLPAR